jgi:hypothetical protein
MRVCKLVTCADLGSHKSIETQSFLDNVIVFLLILLFTDTLYFDLSTQYIYGT